MPDTQLTVVLQARDEASAAVKNLNDTLSDVQNTTKKTHSDFGSMAGAFALGGTAVNAASAAFSFLKDGLMGSVAAAQEAELGQAQLTAVLQSTGMAAGVTAQMANDVAASLSETTTFSDDQILSAANLALTYTGLSDDVFPDVIKTATDMSTALGQDLRSSTDMLGKALQNPIEGTSRLTKIGVNFTEQQKKQIKTLQEAGDVMGAQKVMLGELSTEYGGSAAAAANTYTGRMTQLKNSMGEIQENIGKALLPAMKPLVELFLGQAKATQNATSEAGKLAKFLYGLASVIKGVVLIVIGIVKVIGAFGMQMAQTAAIAIAFAKDVGAAFIAVKNAAVNVFSGLAKAISGDFAGAKEDISKAMDFSVSLTNTTAAMGKFQGTIDSLSSSASQSFSEAGSAFTEAFVQKGFVPVSNAIDGTARKTNAAAGNISDKAKKTAEDLSEVAKKIKEMGENVAEKLTDITKTYTEKSTEMLTQFKSRVAEINADIVKETADFDKETLRNKQSYQQEVVSLFIESQNKLKDLQKEQADLQKELQEEKDPKDREKGQDKLNQIGIDLRKQQDILKQFQGEFSDIEKLAETERSRTELDKLKSRFLTEATERQTQHDAKILDLQVKAQLELEAYQKSKNELIADTVDKYDKIGVETAKGWQKILDDTKLKVKEMKELEQQVQSIKASIAAARASVGGASAPAGARADGGPVTGGEPYLVGERGPEMFIPNSSGTIVPNNALSQPRNVNVSVMEGATINVSNEADERRLAQTVASAIARALQSQRNGLATSF